MKIKKYMKYIPGLNIVWLTYVDIEARKESKKRPNIKFHVPYGIFGTVLLGSLLYNYSHNLIKTKEINPIKQIKITQQHTKRYNRLWDELFVNPAYADKDKNKIISIDERFKAWEKMGLKEDIKTHVPNLVTHKGKYYRPPYSQIIITFPKPKIENLEKAVQSYMYKLKNRK